MTVSFKLGRLPAIDAPSLSLSLKQIKAILALSTPPTSVDYYKALLQPLGMLRNDVLGVCVVAAIVHDFMVTWAATHPGQPIPVITDRDVEDFYWAINTDHVDRGLVSQQAFDRLRKVGIAGHKVLAFAKIGTSATGLRVATAAFTSVYLGVELRQADLSSLNWTGGTPDPNLGHGIESSSYTTAPDVTVAATWGKLAKLSRLFMTKQVVEAWLLIWPWVYNALPTETADQLAADFYALTGSTLPAQVLPPTPEPPPPSRSAMSTRQTSISPARAYDSRGKAPLTPHAAQTISLAGIVPADAVSVTGNLTVTAQTAGGYLAIGPDPVENPTFSRLNFPKGDDRANSFQALLGPGQTLSVTYVGDPGASAHFIVDIDGFSQP